MSGDGAPERRPDDELAGPVREWLASVVADREFTEAEVLDGLAPDGDAEQPGGLVPRDRVDALESDVDAVTDRIEELESAIETDRGDFGAKIDDVRERVIQVKREADEKAPAEHDHPELESELASTHDELDQLREALGDFEATVGGIDDRVRTGFENFEQVVEYLSEATDELSDRVDRLAGGLTTLDGRLRSLGALRAERAALADLLTDANRHGARSAVCDSCDRSVQLGLLAVPRCPHCESGFTGFEPKQGFFGSHTLETGDVPALAGEVAAPATEDATAVVGADDSASVTTPDESEPSTADEPPARGPTGESTPGTAGTEDGPRGRASSETPETRADDRSDPAGGDGSGGARDTDSVNGTPLQAVDGIGPAYADRLHAAGISSAEALLREDADALSAAVDVSSRRTARWIERAADAVDAD